jgi:hypothetical protein
MRRRASSHLRGSKNCISSHPCHRERKSLSHDIWLSAPNESPTMSRGCGGRGSQILSFTRSSPRERNRKSAKFVLLRCSSFLPILVFLSLSLLFSLSRSYSLSFSLSLSLFLSLFRSRSLYLPLLLLSLSLPLSSLLPHDRMIISNFPRLRIIELHLGRGDRAMGPVTMTIQTKEHKI